MIDYLKDNLVKAEALARKAHEGQVDKAGQPYFLHVETVFEQIDREMIQELVEKVEVSYARDSCSYTKCSYNIDITYRIIGPAEAVNAAAAGFSEDKEKAQHAV